MICSPSNMMQFDSGPDVRWLDAAADLYAGWRRSRAAGHRPAAGFDVYVRSEGEGWLRSLWWFATWWEAMAFAMKLADKHGHYFEGRNGHGIA